MKIDEYAPEAMPTIRANAKSLSVAPPNRNNAPTGSSVMKEVASDRRIVSHSEAFVIVAIDERRAGGGAVGARGRGLRPRAARPAAGAARAPRAPASAGHGKRVDAAGAAARRPGIKAPQHAATGDNEKPDQLSRPEYGRLVRP